MHKEVIEQYHQKVWNEKKVDWIHEVFSQDLKTHSPLGTFQTPKEMERLVKKWHEAIPDMRVKTLHILEEGDLCTVHWETTGTHQNEFNGITAKNNSLHYQGCTIYKLKDGKIIEYWAFIDTQALEKQMKA